MSKKLIFETPFLAVLDSRNRVTIPKEVVDLEGLRKGDKVSLRVVAVYRGIP